MRFAHVLLIYYVLMLAATASIALLTGHLEPLFGALFSTPLIVGWVWIFTRP